jgi:Leucine-rich repeat (LRR) protein
VTDISAVRDMPLNTLWLTDTQVGDLQALEGMHLESLDVHGTPISDLTPLRGMLSLRRLDIAESQVTDLTPLAGLRLERLVFTPERIEKGIDVVREMPTLKAIGTSFESVKAAAQFWEKQQ